MKAEVLVWQGEPEQSLNLLSVSPPPELAAGEFAVHGKNMVATALGVLGRRAEAEKALKEAEELALRSAPEWRCETLLPKGNLAISYNQFGQAYEYFKQSLQLARQFKKPYIEAQALGNLGVVSTQLGHFDEAIKWYSDALNLTRNFQYRGSENISIANLGWNYQQLGDSEKAISYLSERLKVIDSLGQEQLKEVVLSNLGDNHLSIGDYPMAKDEYRQALDIARRNHDKFYSIVALSSLALVALRQGNLQAAEEYSGQATALDAHEEHAVLIRARLAAAQSRLAEAESLLHEVIASSNTERYVRWDAQSQLANVFAAENQAGLAENEFQKLVKEVEANRSGVQAVENRLAFSSAAGRFYDDYVQFLVGAGEREKAFQVAEFSRARTLAGGVGSKAPSDPGEISIKGIQRSLKQQNKIILAYWLTPDKSFVWVVSPSGFNLVALGSGDEIERKTREYNEVLQHTAADSQKLDQKGQSLYAQLVAPVEKFIPREAKVVIVPDGGLTKLNFETLRAPNPTPHFWIQDVELETASSSLFIRNREPVFLGHRKVLLMGDPIKANDDYPVLVHAPEELKRVAAHFPANQIVFSREKATPSTYLFSHPEEFWLIHFVTHGTASELSPLESAIVLSPQAENEFKLYARDIVKIPLNAEIVTISACYGLGIRTYSGEGLVGLAWAFLRAGAHQVVAGLWDVDDRASVDLMDDFYTGLLKWKSAGKALRLAKLKMIQAGGGYSRPYYWGSLQLYTGR